MSFVTIPFILLTITTISICFLIYYTKKHSKNNQLNKSFSYVLLCILIISLGVIFQAIGYNMLHISPIYFE